MTTSRSVSSFLVATRLHSFNLLHYLLQVVAGRVLQRGEFDESFEVHQPELLSDRQHVPVVDVGGRGRSNRPSHTEQRLYLRTNRGLKRIALDVDDLRPVIGLNSGDEARWRVG